MKAFQHSNHSFRIVMQALLKSISKQRKFKDQIQWMNELLLRISFFHYSLYYLNNQQDKLKEVIELLFVVASKLKKNVDNE